MLSTPSSEGPRGRLVALTLSCALALAGGCAFDDSRLTSLPRCSTEADCAVGQCVDGYCIGTSFGAVDAGSRDAFGGLDPADLQEGGDSGSDGAPADAAVADTPQPPDAADSDGSPSEDSGRVDLFDDPACANPNACGGCGPLPGTPGDPCTGARCGTYVCAGPGLLSCAEGLVNMCGGCKPLGGQPGDACGDCGGRLACDGADALSCAGDQPNACGGCGGPPGEPNDPCGCPAGELDEEHVLRCSADRLVCGDGNDALAGATPLPDADDVMEAPAVAVGALVDGEGADWYVVRVADIAADNGMFPDVRLTGLSHDHDLCAWFLYQTGGTPEIDCESGDHDVLGDDIEGCCSAQGGSVDEVVRLRNGAWWTDRLDVQTGGGNDDGILYMRVTGGPLSGCEPYRLEYQF